MRTTVAPYGNAATERPVARFRRRRAVLAHRRRRLALRLAKPFVLAVVLVGVPAVVALWIATSPQFLVDELAVGTTGRMSPVWAQAQLKPLLGSHLLTLRVAEVESRLAGHPWFAAVDVAKQVPGRLEIRVTEKSPAALWNRDGRLVSVDAQGRPIGPLATRDGSVDLVVLQAETLDPAAAARAIELSAEWTRLTSGDRVSEVEILGPRDFRVVTSGLPYAVRLVPERLDRTLAKLTRAAGVIAGRYAGIGALDLRFRRQVVFQPAAVPPSREG